MKQFSSCNEASWIEEKEMNVDKTAQECRVAFEAKSSSSFFRRELTCRERGAIRRLVTGMCANYDKEYGCLPLDCECYMLGKWWTGAYCRYFQNAVLPNNPVLEAALIGQAVPEQKICPICSNKFILQGKKVYCSSTCASIARKKRQRGYMRKRRS